jgi:hypothetical protein
MKVRPFLEFKRLGLFLAFEMFTPCGGGGRTRMCGLMRWGRTRHYSPGPAKVQRFIEWFMPTGWFERAA